MNQALKIKYLLLNDVRHLAAQPGLFAKDPLRDFTRNRKLCAENVLLFPILMERDSLDRELLKFFYYDVDTPTISAYYQQRRKLNPDTFRQLLLLFNNHFFPTLYKNKYILTAVDGSGFNIPRNPSDTDSFNPHSGKSGQGHNEMHVVAAYLPVDRVYTDAVIQPSRKKNEFSAICDLVDGCRTDQGTPIFLADRGFPSFNFFAHAQEKGVHFLVRAKDLYVTQLLGSDLPAGAAEFDLSVDRIITRSRAKKKRLYPEKPQLYRCVDKKAAFDYIPPGSSDEYSLHLRVVRVKIAGGSYENLITNLPPGEFSMEDLRSLYYIRWKVETSFRELKHAVGATDFLCKSREYIVHEIWARLLLYNFCSRITSLVVIERKNTRHVYQVNYSMAIKNCHDFLRQHTLGPQIDILSLIRKYICPVRPNRNFDRQHRFQPPMKFSYRH